MCSHGHAFQQAFTGPMLYPLKAHKKYPRDSDHSPIVKRILAKKHWHVLTTSPMATSAPATHLCPRRNSTEPSAQQPQLTHPSLPRTPRNTPQPPHSQPHYPSIMHLTPPPSQKQCPTRSPPAETRPPPPLVPSPCVSFQHVRFKPTHLPPCRHSTPRLICRSVAMHDG